MKNMIIRHWFALLLLPLLLIGACGKQNQKLVEEKAFEKELTNALVWKISHDSLAHDSYLFGTIHIIDEEDYFLPKGLLTAIDESEKVLFEIDVREMNDVSKMMGMMNKIMMEGDTTLKDLLSPADYAVVHSYFQEKGMPLVFLERIKPLFLSAFTSLDEMPQGLDDQSFTPQGMKSYEMELLQLTEAAGKNIGGLETIDFQLSLFDQIPYDVQAQYLVQEIRESMKGKTNNEIFDLYRSQDINAMAASIKSEDNGNNFEDILLTKRNENWIPLMEKEMNKAPTLFAVGAGHLGGEKGVIRLLMREGYTLIPLSANN